jgi:hypothetical protein
MKEDVVEPLFELIQTLDRNEKGYFKKLASVQVKNPVYLELFDSIAAQKTYDEAKLRRKFKSEPFARQFSVAKHDLYQLVLKSLRQYHLHNNINLEIGSMADNAELLMARGLHAQAAKQGERLSQLAEAMDNTVRQIQAKEIVRRAAGYLPTARRRALVKDAQESIERLIAKLQRELPMHGYYFDVYDRMQSSREKTHQQPTAPPSSPYEEGEIAELGYRSQMLYHTTETFQAFLALDKVRAAHHALQLLKLYEANPTYMQVTAAAYVGAVGNYFLCCEDMPEHPDFPYYEKRVRAISEKNPAAKLAAFHFLSLYGINHLLRARRYADVPAYADWFERTLPTEGGALNPAQKLTVMHLTGLGLWFAGDSARALRFFNDTLSNFGTDLRTDLQARGRIVLLAIHLDRGNEEVLESQLRAARNYLRTREYHSSMIELFLHHFAKVAFMPQGPSRKKAFQKMAMAMRELPPDKDAAAYAALRLPDWVESHIRGIPFPQLLQE